MNNAKNYRVDTRGGGDCDNTPSVAIFSINEATAREIIKLSGVVQTNDLHKVEKFDHRARFLQFDPETSPEDAADAGEENDVRTECDVLVVEKEHFFFSAYIKHTDQRVSCEGQSIAELADHFSLPDEEVPGVKYYVGKLRERNGENEYTHTLRFMTDGDPDDYLDIIASKFYDEDGGDEEDGSYSFNGGCLIITPGVCREITKDFYVQCHELGAITGV